jgi:RNA polymerase sigma factor (sigma-70 family)
LDSVEKQSGEDPLHWLETIDERRKKMDEVAKEQAAAPSFRRLQAHDTALQVDPNDRLIYLDSLRRASAEQQAAGKAGYMTRLGLSVAEGIGDMAEPVGVLTGMTPRLDRSQEEFARAIEGVYEGEDPVIRPDTPLVGQWVQKAGRMAYPMSAAVVAGGAAGSAAGAAGAGSLGVGLAEGAGVTAAFLPMTTEEMYADLIVDGVEPEQAKWITRGFAPLEAAIESILVNPWAGVALRQPARQIMRTVAKQAAKNYGKELSEEVLQGTVHEAARQFAEGLPEHGAEAFWRAWNAEAAKAGWEAGAEAAGPLAVMMAPGGARMAAEGAVAGQARKRRLGEVQTYREQRHEQRDIEKELGRQAAEEFLRAQGEPGVVEEQAGQVAPAQGAVVPEPTAEWTPDPKPGETESEYLDRMLGKPGSEERRAGDPAAVEYYRNRWKAVQAQQTEAEAGGEPGTVEEPVVEEPEDIPKTPDIPKQEKEAGQEIVPDTVSPPPPVAKEPWEMTREEFRATAKDRITFSGKDSWYHRPDGKRTLWPGTKSATKVSDLQHANEIRAALKAGKLVPPEVLAEYPELQADTPSAPQPPAPAPTEPVAASEAETGLETPPAAGTQPEAPSVAEMVADPKNGGLFYKEARRLARLNPGVDAEDLVQTAKLKLLEDADTFDPEKGKFSTWAVPKINTAMRRAIPQSRVGGQGEEVVEEAGREEPDLVEQAEILAKLEAVRDRLDPADRELLSAVFGLGGREEETETAIAQREGVSVPAVSQRVKKALARAKRMMVDTVSEPGLSEKAVPFSDVEPEGVAQRTPVEPITPVDDLTRPQLAARAKELGLGNLGNRKAEYIRERIKEAELSRQAAQVMREGVPEGTGKKADQEEVDEILAGETAAQAAQRRAEEARPDVVRLGSGPVGAGPGKGERIREDKIPEVLQAPNPEFERRMQAAEGRRSTPFLERVKEMLRTVKHVATRAQEHLPNNAFFASANEFFRLLGNVRTMVRDEAIRTVAAIVDPLGPNQLKLFQRAAVNDNHLAALKLAQPLRFGALDREEVEAYQQQLQAVIDEVPEVRTARESRRKIIKETVDQLVEYGLLSESAKENAETYYHQQVHFYVQANRRATGGSRPGKTKRSFQHRRVLGESLDEEMDYNTAYIEAETAWLTDAYMEIEKEKLLRKLVEKYDIKPELQKEAQKTNKAQGRNDITWRTLAEDREGYDIFQPEPGNAFYQAMTIPEKIIEALQEGMLEGTELSRDDLRQVLAIGHPNRQFVLPAELADQLRAAKKAEMAHGLAKLADEAMRTWKVWTLLSPKRAVAYNLRNLTGDLDPSVAALPEITAHTRRAFRELRGYHGSRLPLSSKLRLARDLGVVSSGFTAEEVPDLKDLAVFQRFFDESSPKKPLLRRIPEGYFDTVKHYTEFRENLLRYATFLSYLEQARAGKINHYGAARKAVVDQLLADMGPEVAAAHLARNLLGDYGNITVMGGWIRRRLMPFWAFQEINLKRVPRLVVNAYEAGRTHDALGVVSKAAATALLTSRIAWMYGALWAWNNLVMPYWTGDDDEEDLPPYDRANPHIVLGRNPDGSVRVFRNVGALGDFLEWFGINEALSLLDKVQEGQVSVEELAAEMAKAPMEKAAGSLRPEISGGVGVMAGLSLFPEPLQPRSIRRGEAAANIFGLSDEYKMARGMILEDGQRARPHYWQRWIVGVVDPRQSALSEMYDLRSTFLKKKGSEDKGIFPISVYKEARDAAQNEDYDAFVEWRRAFVEKHGEDARGRLKAFLSRMDPISARLSNADEVEFETKFLTPEQRGQLVVARQYAGELHDLLLSWWDAADKTGEASLRDEVISGLAARIAGPLKDPKKEEDKFAINQAISSLARMGVSFDDASKLLSAKLRKDARKEKRQPNLDTLLSWKGRLRRRWPKKP